MKTRRWRFLFSWIAILAMALSLFPAGLVEVALAESGGVD